MISIIAEHSVNIHLLSIHSNILDLGCRDFEFANFFHAHMVYPLDIAALDGEYYQIAISDKNGTCGIKHTADLQGAHIIPNGEIRMMTIDSFSDFVKVKKWDLIKMDIEGEEIKVLRSLEHPYCKQITVEFHAHCRQTKEELDSLLDWLEKWYHIHNRVWESRHGAGFNYWDVLLIAR